VESKSTHNEGTRTINILFAGGGTGGHLFPALAIADEVKQLRPDANILFVGTKKKIEARIVPGKGYAFRTIWISGFHRRFRMSNILFPLKVVSSLVQSFFIVKTFRPDVVVGTGGYVAGPLLYAASVMGIPIVVHESNSFPGVTTKLLASRATKVLITFETTKRWLKRHDNVELLGNPTRVELGQATREGAAKFFKLHSDKKTLLVFGGSLGAASINNAVSNCAGELIERGIQIIWQTGDKEYEHYRSALGSPSVWVGAFIDRMEFAYAASDLVVSRAGATTLAELTRLGKPAILVPYPHAAEDHQTKNAQTLVDAGAALMIDDRALGSRLKDTILQLLFNETALKNMGASSLTLGKPDAGKEIAKKIVALAQ
jgi:UDP-N-acetylglucosamine--N-acetylmuramyl-(pentapeptide) pyrophosphoryl-undecaprenol N-acetylglucosamine transferase